MDTRTGKILDAGTYAELRADLEAKCRAEELGHFVEMQVPPTARQLKRGKVGRNDPCPCGSGMKFKKCCLLNQ